MLIETFDIDFLRSQEFKKLNITILVVSIVRETQRKIRKKFS